MVFISRFYKDRNKPFYYLLSIPDISSFSFPIYFQQSQETKKKRKSLLCMALADNNNKKTLKDKEGVLGKGL